MVGTAFKYVPQPEVTTFALPSVFILLLWRQVSTDTCDTVGELATFINTQHNSDPKFTAEGDVLRRHHHRHVSDDDSFRPIQELI